jgi:hypothetical protein
MGFWWWWVNVARAVWGVKDAALQQVGPPSGVVHWRAGSNMGRPEIGMEGGTVLEPEARGGQACNWA